MSRNAVRDHRHIEHAPIRLDAGSANNDVEPVLSDVEEPIQRSVREFRGVPHKADDGQGRPSVAGKGRPGATAADGIEHLAPDYPWPNRRPDRPSEAAVAPGVLPPATLVRTNTSREAEHSPLLTQRIPAQAESSPVLRRVLTGLLAAALLAGATWGIVTLRDPATLPIRAVKVEGRFTHVTAQALQQAVADAATGGFLSVDVDAIRRAALSLPWVHSVGVRRVWPDTLRLTVTEQTAVARWGEQSLINSNGDVFTPDPSSFPPGLPELRGPAGTEDAVLSRYRAMNEILAPLKLRITRMELDERRAWRLSMDGGMELVLGREQAEERLQRFINIYPALQAAEPPGIARVDMRYSNGFALQRKVVTN
ncbi:MAG: cell division protein FtsQ/DivIB [Gammaproteobacteria bacterium]|nr:cell division protein FtsQ/DivIB [Gammaproteobacteria bacterium]